MNILVVGNGFDLAHGLPTKYTDFLYFCNAIKKIIESSKLKDIIPQKDSDYVEWINNKEITFSNSELDNFSSQYFRIKRLRKDSERDKKVYKEMFEKFIKEYFWEGSTNQKWIKEILYLISNNVWIEYFLECDMHGKENWIDFESKISKVIRAIDSAMEKYKISLYEKERNFKDGNTYDLNQEYDKILKIIKKCKTRNEEITYIEIRNYLLMDLEKLVRVLEIYLIKYVEKIDYKLFSPDIQQLQPTAIAKVDGVTVYDPIYVLSFNYTNIYQNLYQNLYVIAEKKV